jgi:hypothetical protein
MSCIDSRTGDRFGCIHNLSLWQGCRLILSFAFPEDFDAEMPGDIPPFLPRAEGTYAALLLMNCPEVSRSCLFRRDA